MERDGGEKRAVIFLQRCFIGFQETVGPWPFQKASRRPTQQNTVDVCWGKLRRKILSTQLSCAPVTHSALQLAAAPNCMCRGRGQEKPWDEPLSLFALAAR